ncbi:MAG: SPOR domain-containing protein [Gammaproteobacteria bacterium]|nr:SPOR domain-containing protein [Gammaproteobacteria bacterium]
MAARRQVKKNRQGAGSSWMWFFSGLLSGLLLMTLALQSGLISMPRNLQQAVDRSEREMLEEAAISGNRPATDRSSESGDYDFFRILPEQDIVVPQSEVLRQADRQAQQNSTSQENTRYILQVASLRSAADADALKARLLLLGMQPDIIKVNVDGDTWHRVRVGPVDDARAANAVRNQLLANGFDAMIIKAR